MTFGISISVVKNAAFGNSDLRLGNDQAQEISFSVTCRRTNMGRVEYKLVRSIWVLIYKHAISVKLLAQ